VNAFGLGLYEYLSFILPGGLVVFVGMIGFRGWHWHEPGTSELAGLVAAAFVVGQLTTAVAVFLEPLCWLRRPGSQQDSLQGLFGRAGYFTESERPTLEKELHSRFGPDLSIATCFALAYTELQQAGKDHAVQKMNQELAFNRNMAGACLLAALMVIVFHIAGRRALPITWTLPILVASLGLFAYRFRRFWRRFAHNVIRGFLAQE
jgi:hypothetical protein